MKMSQRCTFYESVGLMCSFLKLLGFSECDTWKLRTGRITRTCLFQPATSRYSFLTHCWETVNLKINNGRVVFLPKLDVQISNTCFMILIWFIGKQNLHVSQSSIVNIKVLNDLLYMALFFSLFSIWVWGYEKLPRSGLKVSPLLMNLCFCVCVGQITQIKHEMGCRLRRVIISTVNLAHMHQHTAVERALPPRKSNMTRHKRDNRKKGFFFLFPLLNFCIFRTVTLAVWGMRVRENTCIMSVRTASRLPHTLLWMQVSCMVWSTPGPFRERLTFTPSLK